MDKQTMKHPGLLLLFLSGTLIGAEIRGCQMKDLGAESQTVQQAEVYVPRPTLASLKTKRQEIIITQKDKEHIIEIEHLPRPTTPDWKMCYGPACMTLDVLANHVITNGTARD